MFFYEQKGYLSYLVAGNTPLVSFMFFARNVVAWARWTKPCGQNTSHSNSGAPWLRKYGKLPIRENLVIT